MQPMTGDELRTIRERWQWTQRTLAKHCGVSSNTIARWERGQHRVPEPVARLLAHQPKKAARQRESSTGQRHGKT
jgi:putative transcriptional regulator